jgi:outer membrane protein
MKCFLSRIVPGLLLISLLGGSAFAQGKTATIDLRKVFENYYKKKQAQAAIDERKADMEKDIKAMLGEYDKTNSVVQTLMADANNSALSAEERDKRKKSAEEAFKQLKEMEDSIRKYQRQAETTLDEQRTRLIDNIVVDIRKVVTAKAKTAGFAMVFDTSATSFNRTPVVLYSNNENDITEDVLKDLNQTAPADLPKSDDSKDTKEDKKDGKKKDEKKK